MNPLKERRTKAITTLFISSALLVGFMTMSLGLSQTASAQPENRPTPQCPDGSRFVPSEGCIREVCPPDSEPRGDVCIVETEVPKVLTCPNPDRPDWTTLVGETCRPNENAAASRPAVLACPPDSEPRGDVCIVETEVPKIEETTQPGKGNNP